MEGVATRVSKLGLPVQDEGGSVGKDSGRGGSSCDFYDFHGVFSVIVCFVWSSYVGST